MTYGELIELYMILQKEGLYDEFIEYLTNKKGTN